MSPFFSIGITAYKRPAMLKECLDSILRQDFDDFEVIIGNDDQEHELSLASLEVSDSRVRVVNYETNLGPIGNANALMSMSVGRYFTLLADDDLHSRFFMRSMFDCLSRTDPPKCVFSAFTSDYHAINNEHADNDRANREAKIVSGPQLLELYLLRKVKIIGCYGVFDTKYLISTGGMRQLGEERSYYAEMPLVLGSALLDQVGYVGYPLVFFRAHEGSLSYTNTNVEGFVSSQKALVDEAVVIFGNEKIVNNFDNNFFLLLKWCIGDFATVVHRSGSIRYRMAGEYFRFFRSCLARFNSSDYYWKAISSAIILSVGEMRIMLKGKLRKLLKGA